MSPLKRICTVVAAVNFDEPWGLLPPPLGAMTVAAVLAVAVVQIMASVVPPMVPIRAVAVLVGHAVTRSGRIVAGLRIIGAVGRAIVTASIAVSVRGLTIATAIPD